MFEGPSLSSLLMISERFNQTASWGMFTFGGELLRLSAELISFGCWTEDPALLLAVLWKPLSDPSDHPQLLARRVFLARKKKVG